MEVIVMTSGELRTLIRSELEGYKVALAPYSPTQPKKEPFQTRKEAAKTLKISLQTLHAKNDEVDPLLTI